MRIVAAAVLAVGAPLFTFAADAPWPQWLGPSRDGRAAATGVFPAAGPVKLAVAWRRPLGLGTSGLAAAADRIVTLESDEAGAWATALSLGDGSVLWRMALDRSRWTTSAARRARRRSRRGSRTP
jgi:hypothetical protein